MSEPSEPTTQWLQLQEFSRDPRGHGKREAPHKIIYEIHYPEGNRAQRRSKKKK